MNRQNPVETLRRAILYDAREDASRILADAQAQAEDIQRRAEHRASAEARRIVSEAREEAERIQTQGAARAQLEAQLLQLERREALLQRGFEAATEALKTQVRRPDWPRIVEALLTEAVARLGGESFIVLADAETRQLLAAGELDAHASTLGVTLALAPESGPGTGIVLVSADGHSRFDNTLEARLQRTADPLRSTVFRALTEDGP